MSSGLKDVSAKLSKIDGVGTFTNENLTVQVDEGQWSTEAINLSAGHYGEGKYTLTMTAEDKVGWQKTLSRSFFYDEKAPEITDLTVNGRPIFNGSTVYTKDTPVTVSGNLRESYGIETFTINGSDDGLPSQTAPFNKSFNLVEGLYPNITIVAKDKAGQSAADFRFDLVVDTTPPVFEHSSGNPIENLAFAGQQVSGVPGYPTILTSDNPVKITGLIKDPVHGGTASGIKEVKYAVTGRTDGPPSSTSSDWRQLNGSLSGNDYILDGFIEKLSVNVEKKIYIRAVDKGDNETVFAHTVKVEPPAVVQWKLNLKNGVAVTDEVKQNAGVWYAKGQFKVEIGGALSSAPTGGASMTVEITKKGSPDTQILASNFFDNWTGNEPKITISGALKEYTVKSGLDDGNYKIKIRATDGQAKELNFTVDGTQPTIMLAPSGDGVLPAHDSWVSTKALFVAGSADDATSGIEKIEAIVNSGTPKLLGTESPWSGYLTLAEGDNTVQFRVTDKAGNYTETASRTIKVDINPPTIGLITPANGQALIKDSTSKVFVKVNVSDSGGSNIQKVEYATSIDFVGATDKTPSNGAAEIELTNINSNTTYYFRAVDNAGNKSDSVRVRVQKDNTPPTVEFESHQNDAKVNKKIKIRGSAGDTRELASVKIVNVTTGTDADLIGVSGSSGADSGKAEFTGTLAYSWHFDLDTTQYSDNADLKLKAIATDAAGNTTEKTLTLNVDQDSDRPVVTVTSFNTIGNAQLSGSGTVMLTGTISDDDGTVQSLKVKVGNGSYGDVTFSAGKTSWTYTIPSTVAEGTAVSLDFEVKDAKNTVFTTGDAHGALHRPKVKGISDPEAAFKDDAITFNFDKTRPEIKQAFFSLGTSFATSGTEVGSNQIIGNNNNRKASFKVLAKDTSGIQKVKLTLGTKSKEVTMKTGTETVGSIEYEVWKLEDIELTEGNHVLRIEATDKAGFSNEWQQSVIVDFTAPEIKHLSPSLNGVYFKEVELTGQITDKPSPTGKSVSGVDDTSVQYKIGNSGYGTSHSPGSEELSKLTCSSGTWTVAIKDIAKYKTHGATLVTGTLYKVEIKLKVRDKAGNETAEEAYNLTFDPNGGTPSLEVLTPKADEKIGGSVAISGTAQVANPASGKFVKEIYLQLSKTPIASSATSVPSLVLDGHDYGGADGYNIKTDTNGIGYWSYTLSDTAVTALLGSNHEQPVYFRVRGKNNETPAVVGEWSPVRKFTLSDDVAKFSTIKLKKPGDIVDSSNPLYVDQTYIPNARWLTGDTFTIEGEVTHTSGIANDKTAKTQPPVAPGIQSLNTTGSASWFTSITNGYKFVIPVKTSHYAEKNGNIEFDITAADARTQGSVRVSTKISLKYDNAKPAVVFGKAKGKFANVQIRSTEADGVSVEVPSGKTLAETITELHKNVKNLYLFVETNDSSAKAIPVKTITASGTAAKVTFDSQSDSSGSQWGILVEKQSIVFDGASNYQLTGYAYDRGSKLKQITASMGTLSSNIVSFSDETGSFVSFKKEVVTKKNGSAGIDDGGHTLTLTPEDKAGNIGAVDSSAVSVRNTPLKISEVVFNSDLNGDGAYENKPATGLVETVKRSGSDEFLTPERNYAQEMDIKAAFTIKNKETSQIKFTLDSTQTASTFEIYKDNLSGTALTSGNLTGNAINFSASNFGTGKIEDGDGQKFIIVLKDAASTTDTERKLTLTVTMNVKINDTRKPSVFVAPFYWNSEGDNSLASNDRTKGHIEIKAVSGGGGTSDVSGKVVICGTAYHPAKLSKLELTVPGVTGTLTSEYKKVGTVVKWDGTELKVTDKRLDLNGHWVNWEYEWTTGDVGSNKQITLKAYHGTSTVSDTTLRAGTRQDAQARDSQQSLTLAAGDSAVVGQFLRIIDATGTGDGDQSYLVTITSVEGSVVKWENVLIPTTVNKYYLYPRDYTGNEPKFNQPMLKVNVVPYIREITTKLTTAYSSNPTVFSRSATGAYPVRNDEIITVHGFNLKAGSGNPTVSIGTINGTPTTNEIKVTLNSSAKSGELDVTVDSVKSINNINSNAVYNMQPNGANNDLLNDDTKLRVWKFNAVNTDTGVRYPTMRIGKDSGQTVGFVYGSGAEHVRMNLQGQTFAIDCSFTQWYDTGCAVDNVGRIYGAAMNGDSGADGTHSYNKHANFGFYAWNTYSVPGQTYNRYNSLKSPNTNGDGAYSKGLKKVALENSYDGTIFASNRIVSPKIATKGSGNVYMSYYDASANQVKFRYGTVSGNPNSDSQLTFGGALGNHNNANQGSAAGAVAIASGDTAGPYVAVGVVPAGADAGRAIVAWYDSQNQRLVYKYSASASSYSTWSDVKVIDTGFVGWYVDLVADKDGGIHIAYYSAQNGDLKYAYLSKYDANPVVCSVDSYLSVGTNISIEVSDTKTTFKKYKVDENTGSVTEDGTEEKYVPYISYYMSSFTRTSNSVRVAYLAQTKPIVKKNDQGKYELAANIADGVKNDKYTGTWEAMTIPTKKIPLDYTVGVGIKKNASNVQSVMLGYGTTGGLETAILE